ncbi:hypothetical protein [Streptomyces deccanensis]|uniref:hypothetical protein n=1 Tax=Streptomyces deccanensis TaxID=424188 RepID=UPI001EFBA019|nr:hypothetical protein [Streptomyces deccanensis]ULR48445.1 hypothetical protein L3078_03675 [Streptomyces deccanensis]
MSLQASEFFAELCLPFRVHTVVGNTYFATPIPGMPLRLRVDFSGTIHADTYGGLRLAVLHPDRGEIDAVTLGFVEHGTFHRRDEATNTRPNTKRYGTFDTYCRPGRPPWEGAVTTGLRDAIERYTAVWFPGAEVTFTPKRTVSHAPRTTPAPLANPTGARTR